MGVTETLMPPELQGKLLAGQRLTVTATLATAPPPENTHLVFADRVQSAGDVVEPWSLKSSATVSLRVLLVRPVAAALKVILPDTLGLTRVAVATPEEALTALVVAASKVAVPVPLKLNVIELVAVVTVLPLASWTVAVRVWVAMLPVSASFVAVPAVTVIGLVSLVRPVVEAVIVVAVPDLLPVRVRVATPLLAAAVPVPVTVEVPPDAANVTVLVAVVTVLP